MRVGSDIEARGGVALVLASGAARGAYEAGVIQYIVEEVARDTSGPLQLPILCGTSVGAVNVCFLAAQADDPRRRGAHLVEHWASLDVREILRPDGCELLATGLGLLGRLPPWRKPSSLRGGLVRIDGFRRVLAGAIPFERIDAHLRAGRLSAVSVSTTHVATGRTVVFVARAGSQLPPWRADPAVLATPAHLTSQHALASAAMPILFPAVRIGDELYCDGGLRQNVPLSPAHRLGASGLIVVSPHHITNGLATELAIKPEVGISPLFLLGKTLNALLLDRIEGDLDRLGQLNQVLRAGIRRYGPRFVDDLNEAMGVPRGPLRLRPLPVVVVRASQDVARMSAAFARSKRFANRAPGIVGRVLRRLADEQSTSESDLLSYLLFDGEFARELIELGRADARAQHEELCTLFETRGAEPPTITRLA